MLVQITRISMVYGNKTYSSRGLYTETISHGTAKVAISKKKLFKLQFSGSILHLPDVNQQTMGNAAG